MRTVLLRIIHALCFAPALIIVPTLFAEPGPTPDTQMPSSVQAPTSALKIGGAVSAPSPRHIVEPEYSEEARRAGLSGRVIVALVVDAKGIPQNVHIVRALGMGLDEKAIEAVKRYTFDPAKLDGKPVPVLMDIEVEFHTSRGPHLIHSFPAELSSEARQQNFRGTVEVALTIDENGIPRDVHVLHPVGMGLDKNAVKAAELYTFDPVISNGIPVRFNTVLDVRFKDK